MTDFMHWIYILSNYFYLSYSQSIKEGDKISLPIASEEVKSVSIVFTVLREDPTIEEIKLKVCDLVQGKPICL